MKFIASTISYIFHPLFVLLYILVLLISLNPYIFQMQDEKAKVIFFIYTFVSLIVIPVIAILILKQVNIIKSFSMEDKMERVGPLIIVGILYLWLYINFKNTASVPLIFSSLLLGSVISVFVSFFINNFTKISLHTVGMGGFIASILIMKYSLNYNYLSINLKDYGEYSINTYFILLLVIILSGLVGTMRLYLKLHSKEQIYSGYILGFFAQLIAFNIVM